MNLSFLLGKILEHIYAITNLTFLTRKDTATFVFQQPQTKRNKIYWICRIKFRSITYILIWYIYIYIYIYIYMRVCVCVCVCVCVSMCVYIYIYIYTLEQNQRYWTSTENRTHSVLIICVIYLLNMTPNRIKKWGIYVTQWLTCKNATS